jgi:RNA polymerase sigma-70 factor (ECF subfamily)
MAVRESEAALLLSEARGGSADALGRLLEHYRPYLLLVAERELDPGLRAKGGASDLVQETFLEAHRDLPRLFTGSSDDELRAWLRRLLLNNLGTFARSFRGTAKREVGREVCLGADDSRSEPVNGLAARGDTPSRVMMANESAETIKHALSRLPDDYRRVIQLRYEESRSFEEVGRIMGRTPEAARKLWARAMERLRAEWEAGP